jgi:hypothetical protein
VKDDALECPECGRILPRGAREAWPAARLAPSLVWLCLLGGVVMAAAGLAAALAWLGDHRTLPAVLALLGGVLGASILIVGGFLLRALARAVERLEDRIP